MADPKPLTDEQIAQRDALNSQAAAYEAAQSEKNRKAKQESLVKAGVLADLLTSKDVTDAFDTALNDEKLDFETKARIQSMRSTLSYNIDQIKASIAAVADPKTGA